MRVKRRKEYGRGPSQALDRNDKARIIFIALARSRTLARRGSRTGPITRATEAVLRALLFKFHGLTGHTFPSYEALMKAANVSRSKVAEAIKTLEELGALTWVHRLRKVAVAGCNLTRRTSNAYVFVVPATESSFRTGDKPSESKANPKRPDSLLRRSKERAPQEVRPEMAQAMARLAWTEDEIRHAREVAAARKQRLGLA